MSVNKIRPCIPKDLHFKDFGRLLKMSSTCPINLWNRSFSSSKKTESNEYHRRMISFVLHSQLDKVVNAFISKDYCPE